LEIEHSTGRKIVPLSEQRSAPGVRQEKILNVEVAGVSSLTSTHVDYGSELQIRAVSPPQMRKSQPPTPDLLATRDEMIDADSGEHEKPRFEEQIFHNSKESLNSVF
jgi:hypothetical protein